MQSKFNPEWKTHVTSEAHMFSLGRRLGQCLLVWQVKGKLTDGFLLGLQGELGAGKTVFVRGLAEGLQCTGRVTSPTYTIVQRYAGRLTLVHVDAYRVHEPDLFRELGLDEQMARGAVVAVEWPERFANEALTRALMLKLGHGDHADVRTFQVYLPDDGPARELLALDISTLFQK